jgi:predicted CoA-substrate-specific enzyme activase
VSNIAAIGIDIGSTTWKAVAIDAAGIIQASRIEQTDPLIDRQTERILGELKDASGAPDSVPIAATGYGRKRVRHMTNRVLTEITCHARGAFFHTNRPGMLIDIGGQDTKIIHIGPQGDVIDFAMNDKCAAGTGRFLEVILGRLHVPFDQIQNRLNEAQKAITISSTCTVFAESEVVSLVAQGESVGDIVSGLHQSLASRVSSLAGKLAADVEIFMSGGVSQNAAMVRALGDRLGHPVRILPQPQLIGALGAALSVRN